ncbi:hypothetical protein D0T56_02080 [Dysgonomonas sp. 520]|nr:hypothetical protein [Dysgonomonas sp. 520]
MSYRSFILHTASLYEILKSRFINLIKNNKKTTRLTQRYLQRKEKNITNSLSLTKNEKAHV